MAWDLGVRVARVYLVPRVHGMGGCCVLWGQMAPHDDLLITLAGPAVNTAFGFDWDGWCRGRPDGDEAAAAAALARLAPRGNFAREWLRALRFVHKRRGDVEALGRELLRMGSLSGEEVEGLLAGRDPPG
jgi:hypothetical protein